MSYNIIPTDNFNKQVKQLAKKYRSIKSDLIQLKKNLLENPTLGIHLGNNVYKIRMAISSKNRGKSGGARVLTYVLFVENEIYLLSLFDKSEKENVSDLELKQYLREVTFLKNT